MNYLRIFGFVAGVGAIVGVIALILTTIHKAELVDGYRACTKAATSPAAPLDPCDEAVRARVTAARRAAVCEAALDAKPVDGFAVALSCGTATKTLLARATAAEGNLADAQAQLGRASAERDAAVSRADARNQTLADRKAVNDRILQVAPRLPDGRVRCDAKCLRSLAGR